MDEPKYVLGPVTSLLAWRAISRGALDEPRKPLRLPDLGSCRATVREVRNLPVVQALGDVPLDVIVGSSSRTHECKSIDTIVLKGPLPDGSLRELGGGVYFCSPELCYVLLARGGFDYHLIELGCEFCGTYCVSQRQAGLFEPCAPRTTCEKLGTYLERLGRRHGVRPARKALAYVQDGSASPRQTSLLLALTLDPMLGGYGMPKPLLNAQIDISRHAVGSWGEGHLIVDELFVDEFGDGVAVGEYRGDQRYFYPRQALEAVVSDEMREAIPDEIRHRLVEAAGMDIVTFQMEDRRDFRFFDAQAMRLGRLVGCEPLPSRGILKNLRYDLLRYLFDTKRPSDEYQLLRRMAGYERCISHPRAKVSA